MLTEAEKDRLADVIDNGKSPLTYFERNLLEIIAGRAKPDCPKVIEMAAFASELEGARLLKLGLGLRSDVEVQLQSLRAEQDRYEEDQKQYQDWTDDDWGAYYVNSDDPNEQEMGRAILAGTTAMKEVDAETVRLLTSSEEIGGDDQGIKANVMVGVNFIKELAYSMLRHAAEIERNANSLIDEATGLRARANAALCFLGEAPVSEEDITKTQGTKNDTLFDYEDDIPF